MTQTPLAPRAYEILFAFTGKAGTVLEIKRLGLPAGTPRSRKYQWLWIDTGNSPGQALALQFVSMHEGERQERVFAQGTLRFDERDAQWTPLGEETRHLQACAADAVPPEVAAVAIGHVAAD